MGNLLGNKGAVAVRLVLDSQLKLMFIGSHLAAHAERVADRNADFHRIASGLFSGKDAISPRPMADGAPLPDGGEDEYGSVVPAGSILAEADLLVIWLGDLNYRLAGRAECVRSADYRWLEYTCNTSLSLDHV